MKKAICLALIFLLLITIAGCDAPTEKGAAVLNSFNATDLTGASIDEGIFAGKKLTMVNIWATYCDPCISEMPALAQLNTSYGEDFQVIGIVKDAADKNGNPFLKQYTEALDIIHETGAHYLHLLPSPSLSNAYLYRVHAVPETIFVDESGYQVGTNYTGAKSLTEWKQIIEEILKDIT